MEENTFEKNLAEMFKAIEQFPNRRNRKPIVMLRRGGKSAKNQINCVENIQDSLDYLRVSIKYLMFDLEATRRENAALRRRLAERE